MSGAMIQKSGISLDRIFNFEVRLKRALGGPVYIQNLDNLIRRFPMPGECMPDPLPMLSFENRGFGLEIRRIPPMQMLRASTGESYPDPASLPLFVTRAEKERREREVRLLGWKHTQRLVDF